VYRGGAGNMFGSAVGLPTAARATARAADQAPRYSRQPGRPLDPALARIYPAA
jgi:hypothetical protein